MPRRHISQREAHATAKRLKKAQRRLLDLRYPAPSDDGCLATMRALPIDERYRGFLEGARAGRPITLAARLTEDGIVLYLYTEAGA